MTMTNRDYESQISYWGRRIIELKDDIKRYEKFISDLRKDQDEMNAAINRLNL